MPTYALLSASGHCEGILTMDAPSAAAHPLHAGESLRPVTAAEASVLRQLGRRAMARPSGWTLVPASDEPPAQRAVVEALQRTGKLDRFAEAAVPAPIGSENCELAP